MVWIFYFMNNTKVQSTLYLGPLYQALGDYKWLVSVSKTVKYVYKRVRVRVCNARVCGVIDVRVSRFEVYRTLVCIEVW